MQLPAQANSSDFYKLISGALLASDRAYGDVSAFFKSEFNDYFTGAQWKSVFGVASENRSGNYTQMIGKINVPVMASYVAYDGEAPLISNTGFELNTKNMPRMKLAYNFNEKSARDGAYLLQNSGLPNYGPIFDSFLQDSANLISGIHTQLSYTALQVESTGKYLSSSTNNGGGIKGLLFDFQVPAANQKKAGGWGTVGTKYAWSSASAYPIGDLLDMVKFADDYHTMNTSRAVIRMNKTTWNLLRNHATTKAAVALQVTGGGVLEANIPKYMVTDTQVQSFLTSLGLPPIEVVAWSGIHQALNIATQQIEKQALIAFADNTVVLRPSGEVGKVQWQAPTTMFATSANPMYVTDNGMIGVQQEVFSQRKAMQFTAEFTGIPVPYDVSSMLYLDISQAAS
jgi:hypothetical protein